MNLQGVLTTLGIVRPVRPQGFCPACRRVEPVGAAGAAATVEVTQLTFVALAVLAAAAVSWFFAVWKARSMGAMAMGLGPVGSFAASWTVMMAAMMLPSALPLVMEFARVSHRRKNWWAGTLLLGATYIAVWLVFGLAAYALYTALQMPWPDQRLISGLVLVLAGVYAITPLKRAFEARCRQVCALHGPSSFNLFRRALSVGTRYGVTCIGCTAPLMVAMVLMGMTAIVWMVILAAAVLLHKLVSTAAILPRFLLSASLVLLGVAYVVLA